MDLPTLSSEARSTHEGRNPSSGRDALDRGRMADLGRPVAAHPPSPTINLYSATLRFSPKHGSC